MKELPKILYTMRMTLFILQFVALFMIISSLLQMKIVFYLFIQFFIDAEINKFLENGL